MDQQEEADMDQHEQTKDIDAMADPAECPYNGWRSWATWHAYMTLTAYEEGLYEDARAEAAQVAGADAFAAWALPRYMEALRALGEATPWAYAEPDAIDWQEVWDALRED